MFSRQQDPPLVLDNSLSFFFNQLPKDLRSGNPERQFWKTWQGRLSLYNFKCKSEQYRHEQCWGWTIIRTSYKDDEKFRHAVSAIHRLGLARLEEEYLESRTSGRPDNSDVDVVDQRIAEIPGHPNLREHVQRAWHTMVEAARGALPAGEPLTPDWVITNELARRYHNHIVQDRDALEGAKASEAWKHVRALDIEEEEQGARGALFVYLDEESIDLLARAPGPDELARMSPDDRARTAWRSWVKVVSTACEVAGDGDDMDEMMADPLARRRVRLYDFFEVFLRLCEGCLDEMGVEGEGRRGFVEGPKWTFCRLPGASGRRAKWLDEFYGEEDMGR
ncbi:hypothetical protein KVR01_009437 [Diaporthe batatas]|uniref:uncharacterized protein n=1 Tax=Diaporthe batatas TaxID=748121 RepID=UPI001D0488B9|nr:uncharacterized protein KVR01_009437 [Diaporthe batatas]KAG8161173.1 hypothetical protein KVR01_009437 [Diaporthe batatas]